MKYYYSLNNERLGPVDKDHLKGIITRDTLIWFDGLENWKKASDIPELLSLIQSTPPPLPNETKTDEVPIVDVRILKDKTPIITPKGEVVIANELKDNFILIVISLVIGFISFLFSAGIKNTELSQLSNGFESYKSERTQQFNTLKNGFFINDDLERKARYDTLYDDWLKDNQKRLDELYSKSKELGCYVRDSRYSYVEIADDDAIMNRLKNTISYNYDEARGLAVIIFFISLIVLIVGRYALKSEKWVGDRTK